MTEPLRYPLLCSFQDLIIGNGFAAGIVTSNARALAVQEPGNGWWIYGVNPGPVAGTGESLHAALSDFRMRIRLVLIDSASEAPDFASFEAAVRDFFGATDDDSQREWEEARLAVRKGRVELSEGVVKVPRPPLPRVVVKHLELKPTVNPVTEDQPRVAA